MSEIKQKDNQNMRSLLFKKYIIELITIGILLVVILILACNHLIDGNITGTLLGTIVGYSLKNPRKYQN